METLFASLLSYGATTKLLAELLPLDQQLNAVTVRNRWYPAFRGKTEAKAA